METPRDSTLIELTQAASILRVKWAFFREEYKKGTVKLRYRPTKDMLADLLTKPLGGKLHTLHRSRIFTGCKVWGACRISSFLITLILLKYILYILSYSFTDSYYYFITHFTRSTYSSSSWRTRPSNATLQASVTIGSSLRNF